MQHNYGIFTTEGYQRVVQRRQENAEWASNPADTCDFGHCLQPATHWVDNRGCEWRPMCARHADFTRQLDSGIAVYKA